MTSFMEFMYTRYNSMIDCGQVDLRPRGFEAMQNKGVGPIHLVVLIGSSRVSPFLAPPPALAFHICNYPHDRDIVIS